VEVDSGQLGVVVQHALKVGCTVQYAWVLVDGLPGLVNAGPVGPSGVE
jgi:hypothetical protein